jgi:hypothetical protein
VGPRHRSCRCIVAVVVESGQHRAVVMRSSSIVVIRRVVSSPGFVIDVLCRVICRCRHHVVSSSSVGGVCKVSWVEMGVLTKGREEPRICHCLRSMLMFLRTPGP